MELNLDDVMKIVDGANLEVKQIVDGANPRGDEDSGWR